MILIKIRSWFSNPVNILWLSLIGFLVTSLQGALFTDEFKATLLRPIKLANADASFLDVISASWPLVVYVLFLGVGVVLGIISILSYSSDYVEMSRLKVQEQNLTSTVSKLEGKIQALSEVSYFERKQLDALLETQLKSFVKPLGFGEEEHNNDRVSVYLPSKKDNCFYLAARYSPNPMWAKNSENEYGIHKGVVGKAWANGKYFVNDLPDWSSGQRQRNRYTRICRERYGYSDVEIGKMRMRSRLYLGWAVSDLADTKPAGVVVIESIQVDRWPESTLSELFEEQKLDLRGFVNRLAMQNERKDYLIARKNQIADTQHNKHQV